MSETEATGTITAVEDGDRRIEFATPPAERTWGVEWLAAKRAARSGMGEVGKSGRNTFDNYDYSKLNDFLDVLEPALGEHGLLLEFEHIGETLWFDTISDKQPVGVKVRLAAELWHVASGQYRRYEGIGEAWDRGDKALYKAITGARKYLIQLIFDLYSGDDPEKDSTPEHENPFKGRGGAPASTEGKTGKSGGLTKEQRDQRKAEADAKKKAAMEGAAGGAPASTGKASATPLAGHTEKDVLERGLNSISACKTVAEANQLYDKFGETQWLADHKPVYLQLLDALGRDLEKRKQSKAWDAEQCDGLAASVQGMITHMKAVEAAPVQQELV